MIQSVRVAIKVLAYIGQKVMREVDSKGHQPQPEGIPDHKFEKPDWQQRQQEESSIDGHESTAPKKVIVKGGSVEIHDIHRLEQLSVINKDSVTADGKTSSDDEPTAVSQYVDWICSVLPQGKVKVFRSQEEMETRMQQDIDLAVEGLKLKDRTDLPDPKRNAKLLSKSNQKFLSKKEMGTPLEELVYPEDVDLYYRLVHDNGNEDMFHIQRQHRIEYQGPWTVMEDEIPETTQYSNLFAVTGQLTDLTDLPDPIEGKRVLAIDQAICDLTDDDHEKIMGFFD